MAYSRWGSSSHISNARDCARFGLMVLRKGEWRGQSIVNAEYLRESTKSSQPMNPAYGWLWWLNGTDRYVVPGGIPGTGPMIPPAPPDLIAALGRYDRKIYIVPSLDLVVVRMGEGAGVKRDALSSFDRELWQRLMKAISERTTQ
jgi:CubicO group peptidase (beta-lactamase class C family)